MSISLDVILRANGIDPDETLAIRHTYASGAAGDEGLRIAATDEEILEYTSRQYVSPKLFPQNPPRIWLVFLGEGGNHSRLWSVVENQGVRSVEGDMNRFDVSISPLMADLRDRLVIRWPAPRAWKVKGPTAASYPVLEIADGKPPRFPGFDQLILSYGELQAVVRERRFSSWCTALSSVIGIYVITDMSNGQQYVGKADGGETIYQRWSEYARTGHGGNVQLRGRDPQHFQFSLLRVFDPGTPTSKINAAESHFKAALGTTTFGLNSN